MFKFVDVFKSPSSEVSCLYFKPEEGFLSLSFLYFFEDKPISLIKGAICTSPSPCQLASDNRRVSVLCDNGRNYRKWAGRVLLSMEGLNTFISFLLSYLFKWSRKICSNGDPAHVLGSLFRCFVILCCRQHFLTPNPYFHWCREIKAITCFTQDTLVYILNTLLILFFFEKS